MHSSTNETTQIAMGTEVLSDQVHDAIDYLTLIARAGENRV